VKKEGATPLFFIPKIHFFTYFIWAFINLKEIKFAMCYGTSFATIILNSAVSLDIVKI